MVRAGHDHRERHAVGELAWAGGGERLKLPGSTFVQRHHAPLQRLLPLDGPLVLSLDLALGGLHSALLALDGGLGGKDGVGHRVELPLDLGELAGSLRNLVRLAGELLGHRADLLPQLPQAHALAVRPGCGPRRRHQRHRGDQREHGQDTRGVCRRTW